MRKTEQHPILHNAIQAIRCGIEDYSFGTDGRLKSSVRNVHAGILLLFKEKLARLSEKGSDEALIKQSLVPEVANGKVRWIGRGKKTVDIRGIRERFDSLKVTVDWGQFKSVNEIRNDVEHYYTKANAKAIQEALAKSFGLISDFLRRELKIDPKKKIGDKLWTVFVGIKDVYDLERSACLKTHKHFSSESKVVNSSVDQLSCQSCGSDLIRFKADGAGACRSCGETYTREEAILATIEAAYGVQDYIAVKDGGEPCITDCPECGEEAFIAEEMSCALCGESQEAVCARCNGPIPLGEIGGSMCGYCTYQMSKDD